jgi:cytochrome c oxidase subunit 2
VAQAAEYLKAHADSKVALSGFVDATGNADQNAELAKQRAERGQGPDGCRWHRSASPCASPDHHRRAGADQQARRVDITAAQ